MIRQTSLKAKNRLVHVAAILPAIVSIAHAVLVKTEEIDLSSKSSPHASLILNGGRITAEGWRARGGMDHLVVKLNKPIGRNDWAAVEVHLTNQDLAKGVTKSHFFGAFSHVNGSASKSTRGTFIALQSSPQKGFETGGQECRINGVYGQGLRALYRPAGSGAKKENRGCFCCDTAWNGSKVYRWRMEFKSHRFLLYRDDILVYGIPVFARETELSCFFIGHNKKSGDHGAGYGSFPNLLAKKMIVYRDDGKPEGADPAFQKDHIRVNVGGYDDMVAGWISDAPYATKGREFQWSQAFSTDGVANAAPLGVYKTVRQKNHHYDTKKIYQDSVEMVYPLRDGDWTVRMHFIDILIPEKRSIDVELNGNKVIDNMDIRTEAGRHLLALVKEFPVRIAGGTGLTVTLYDDVNKPSGDYFLCGIEMIKKGSTPAILPANNRSASHTAFITRSVINGKLRMAIPANAMRQARLFDASGRCVLEKPVANGDGGQLLY